MPSIELAKNDDRFNDDHQFEFINTESIRVQLRKYDANREKNAIHWLNGQYERIAGVPFLLYLHEEKTKQAEGFIEDVFAVLLLHDDYDDYAPCFLNSENVPFFECSFDVKLQLMKADKDNAEVAIMKEISVKDVHFYGGHISVTLHIGHKSMLFHPIKKLDSSEGVIAIATVTMKEKRGVVPCILSTFTSPSKLTDVKITVGDAVFYVNKSIIAMNSPVLSSLIYPESLEIVNELFIEDVCPRDFELLLKCIYPEDYKIRKDDVFRILTLAGKFKVDHVMRKCLEFLENFYGDYRQWEEDLIEALGNNHSDYCMSMLFDGIVHSIQMDDIMLFICSTISWDRITKFALEKLHEKELIDKQNMTVIWNEKSAEVWRDILHIKVDSLRSK